MDCKPCDCFDSSDYLNEIYQGFDVYSDWNCSWCYVQGGTVWDLGLDSYVAKVTCKWIERRWRMTRQTLFTDALVLQIGMPVGAN